MKSKRLLLLFPFSLLYCSFAFSSDAVALSLPPPPVLEYEVVSRNKNYVAVGRIPSTPGKVAKISVHRARGGGKYPMAGARLWSVKIRGVDYFYPTETGDGLIVVTSTFLNVGVNKSIRSTRGIKRSGAVVFRNTDSGIVRRNYQIQELSKQLRYGSWLRYLMERPRAIEILGYRKRTKFSRITGLKRR